MKVKHFSKIAAMFIVVAVNLFFASSCSKEDELSLRIIMADDLLSGGFTVDGVTINGDNVLVKAEIDTKSEIFESLQNEIENSRNAKASEIKQLFNDGVTNTELIDSAKCDFSLSSRHCIYTNYYNILAAVETAAYMSEKGDMADKTVVTEFYDKEKKTLMSSIEMDKEGYREIKRLQGLNYPNNVIVNAYHYIMGMENGLRITDSMLPTVIDEYTTLYKVEINKDTYDYYYACPAELLKQFDEENLTSFAEELIKPLKKAVTGNMSEDIFRCIQELNKKYVYHYYDENHETEYAQIYLDYPDIEKFNVKLVNK